jgi:GNAT superfamily N-acetyltransferase
MIRYRPFRNGDSPALAEIWSSDAPLRGLAQPMSPLLLEERVLAKPYFQRDGLVVAEEGERVLGFVHAGFGPTDDLTALSTEIGVTCMLMVMAHRSRDTIADQLLAAAEQYLQGRGARLLYGGGIFPLNPFYMGLYGGSELPGVLASDEARVSLFSRNGYRQADRTVIMHADISSFRPLVDRVQMRVRRNFRVEAAFDPPADTWWEACVSSPAEYTRYQLVPTRGGTPCARVSAWNIEPLARSWGVRAAGLVQVFVDEPLRRQGLATCLLGETMRQLRGEGVTLVEIQVMQRNVAALRLYEKLGFREIEHGIVFRKD